MAKTYTVVGIDTYEATGPDPDDAEYPLASFESSAEAITFAKEHVEEGQRADPELADEVLVRDPEGNVVWSGRMRSL